MVYLEAQAQGCPVLAEDRPGRQGCRPRRRLAGPGRRSIRLRQGHRYARSADIDQRFAAGRKGARADRRGAPAARSARCPDGRARARFSRNDTADYRTPRAAAPRPYRVEPRRPHTGPYRRAAGRPGARASLRSSAAGASSSDAALFSSPLVRAVETARIVGGREPDRRARADRDGLGRAGKAGAGSTCWRTAIRAIAISRNGDGIFSRRGAKRREAFGSGSSLGSARSKGRRSSVSHIGDHACLACSRDRLEFRRPRPVQRSSATGCTGSTSTTTARLRYDNEPVRLIEAGSCMKRVAILVTHLLGTGPSQPLADPGAGVARRRARAAAHLRRHAGRPSRSVGHRFRPASAGAIRWRELHPPARQRRESRNSGIHA